MTSARPKQPAPEIILLGDRSAVTYELEDLRRDECAASDS
jgi:hypothetical protein